MRQGRHRRAVACAAIVAIAAVWLTGCGMLQPVQPWEKGELAGREMRFGGNKLEAQFAEHIYASKEAASGGTGVGGGGCGCN